MASATTAAAVDIDTSTVSPSEKLAAVQAEAKMKQGALRDTIAANETLQRRILELHKQEEAAREEVRAAHIDLDEAKKRQTLQRYYRQRAEEEQKDRQASLAALVAAQGTLRHRSPTTQAAASATPTADGAFTPSNLAELKVIVADTVNRAQVVQARRDKMAAALKDVIALRLKLETALARQLGHTETLAEDLASTKRAVTKEVTASAKSAKEVRLLERSVAEVSRSCASLESELRDVQRQSERLAKRLRSCDANVGSLQGARAESRNNVEGEVSQSERRDAAVLALRKENAELIQWLLDDSPNFIAAEEMERIHQQAAAEAAAHVPLELPAHQPRAPVRRNTLDPREERLFKELEDAIASTTKRFGTTAATAPSRR